MDDGTRINAPHSVRVVGALTAAGFPRICHHKHEYKMTCEEYDRLEARAEGKCELCGGVPPQLHMDHDHSLSPRAVRGLVCPKCNAHLRRIDSGERVADEATRHYLRNPFWRTQLRITGPVIRDFEWYVNQKLRYVKKNRKKADK